MTITTYYRPKTIDDALALLADPQGKTIPLGGGTTIPRLKSQDVSVVDLQDLDLDQVEAQGNVMKVGGTATIHKFGVSPNLWEGMRRAVELEGNFNIRQRATIAGCVVAGDGRSTLLTALLALDGILSWLPGGVEQRIGDFLLTRNGPWPGKIIANILLPVNVNFQFASVGRSPADVPIICVGLTAWPSGRLRIALGGFGPYPILALDAPDSGGAEIAVRDALTHSSDPWASAEYRQEAAAVLVRRILQEI